MLKNISAATPMVLSACIIWGRTADVRHLSSASLTRSPWSKIAIYSRRSVAGSALAYSGENCCHHARPAAAVFDGRPQRWLLAATMLRNLQAWVILTVANLTIIILVDARRDRTLKSGARTLRTSCTATVSPPHHRRRLIDQQRLSAFNDYQPEL